MRLCQVVEFISGRDVPNEQLFMLLLEDSNPHEYSHIEILAHQLNYEDNACCHFSNRHTNRNAQFNLLVYVV